MKFVPALDGVRGVAVGLVILFHYGFLNAGWVGVQIFFVLSGYLISSILLEEREQPLPRYLGRFYWRRSLRIFPLYFLFLAVLALTWASTGAPAAFGAEWPYLLTYTANFARALPSDLSDYTVHIWSLAVEEQFYLIWPLLVFLLPRRAFGGLVMGLLALVPVLRLCLYAYLASGHDLVYAGRLTYVLPATQFDAFATGAAVALWDLTRLRNAGRLFLGALAVAGVAGFLNLVAAHLWRGGADPLSLGYPMYMGPAFQYVWGYSLLNVVSGLGIICVLQQGAGFRWLEWPGLTRVGKVSYGVYVYHLPILTGALAAAARAGVHWTFLTRLAVFPVYLAVVLLVSELSWRYFEKPFLGLKDYWARRQAGQLVARVPEA